MYTFTQLNVPIITHYTHSNTNTPPQVGVCISYNPSLLHKLSNLDLKRDLVNISANSSCGHKQCSNDALLNPHSNKVTIHLNMLSPLMEGQNGSNMNSLIITIHTHQQLNLKAQLL